MFRYLFYSGLLPGKEKKNQREEEIILYLLVACVCVYTAAHSLL